jgi:peptidyl-prolyl cis-trans isomerase SurA
LTSIPRGTIGHGMRCARVYSVIGHSVIRPVLAAAGCLVAALAAAPSPALAQCVILKVNGEVITNDDIGQRTKFNLLAYRKSPPRKEIIDELIDDKLKVQIARRYKIDLTEKDVDAQYADMARRMHWSPEQLTQALNQGGVNATTLKAKILADMSWRYIIRGKFPLQVDEKSVNTEVESQKKGAEAEVGYDYALRPILLLVPSGNAPLLEARRQDADALRARFASCETGLPAAQAQHDVIIRPPITKNSSDFPPALREILNKTELGHLTPPETTPRGVELFALCDKKETKPDTPEKRVAREKLFSSRFEALSKAYLRELRRSAKIEFMQRCRPRLR